MSILGTRVIRTEDPRLLTAGGVYVDDLREPELDGAARATFVRSTGRARADYRNRQARPRSRSRASSRC